MVLILYQQQVAILFVVQMYLVMAMALPRVDPQEHGLHPTKYVGLKQMKLVALVQICYLLLTKP